MKVKLMPQTCLIVLIVLCLAIPCQGQKSPAYSEKLIDLLKRDDLVSALSLIREKRASDPSSRQLIQAETLLDDASRRSGGDFQRIVLRGDVAHLFRSYGPAFALYQDALDKTEQHSKKYGSKNWDFHRMATKAAICAFWLKDHETALRLFYDIESNGDTWVKELGQKKAVLLREFRSKADNVPARIKFAKDFWLGHPAIGGPEDTINFLEETLALDPKKEERKEIYVLLRNVAQTSQNAILSESFLRRMMAELPLDEATAEAAFSTSQLYFKEANYAGSRKWLDWIVENTKLTPRYIPLVYLGLAETWEKLGNETSMISNLKLAAGDPIATPTNRGIMDTSDTRQVALVRLGQYFKSKGNFQEALEFFTEWNPRSFCGNCAAQMRYEKSLYVSECLVGLDRSDEALDTYLLPLLKKNEGSLYSDAKLPRLVVSLYEKKNALDQFLVMIQPHAASQYNKTAQIAQKLAQIKIWTRDQNIPSLVGELRHSPGFVPRISESNIREHNSQAVAAAEALATMGGKEFPFLKKSYEELSTAKQESANADKAWVIYALGVSKAKESETYLQELLQKAKEGKSSDDVRDIEFALSIKKPNQ